MIVQAADMARDVRVAIDMNRGDEPLILDGDQDTLELDEIIRSKLEDAVRMVHMEAPLQLLGRGHDLLGGGLGGVAEAPSRDYRDSGVFFSAGIFWGEGGKGFILLPGDFMRLVAFRMSDWRRTVFEAISERDPRYALQSSRFGGICGNPEKPVVAIVRRAEGLVLEFYSCRDRTAHVAQASYMPLPRIDGDGGIDVAERCYRAAVCRAAALALAGVGDQLAASMLELSKSLLI